MTRSPPLHFLAAVLGGWAAIRTVLLMPPASTDAADAARPAAPARHSRPDTRAPDRLVVPARAERPRTMVRSSVKAPESAAASQLAAAAPAQIDWRLASAARILQAPGRSAASAPPATVASRWTLYGWAFLRPPAEPGLAPGGMLGGAQAGLSLRYRLNRDPSRPLALAARLSSPLTGSAGAEAALGIDWQPSRQLPVHLLAERRQKLGREGRSAFALTLHGGVGELPLGPARVDAYVQAGVVGARSRDLFGDGALRVSLPVGRRARFGAGAWAAAQPGVARLDLGPQASLSLPLDGRSLTVAADWRLRVAGNARPGSGPTLTLATDF